MSLMCDVYDEGVMVSITRNGERMEVPFEDLLEDDIVLDNEGNEWFTVGLDACQSDDVHYEGWVVYSVDGNGYFPEDFGAAIVKKYS